MDMTQYLEQQFSFLHLKKNSNDIYRLQLGSKDKGAGLLCIYLQGDINPLKKINFIQENNKESGWTE